MKSTLWFVVMLFVASVVLVGCMHGRGEHSIPVSRNYKSLEKVKVEDAKMAVTKAHRKGAHNLAQYEYDSAAHYLKWAKEEKCESDLKGAWDYSALAMKYAAAAEAKSPGIPDKGKLAVPRSHADCQKDFERLAARYRELDPCMAQLVAPEVYAHIEAKLSLAEHELAEWGHSAEAWRYLCWIEGDIDAIWAKDTDKDGVVDMKDGEPWIPEDKDGFQDEDGMPEPKPYPQLTPVHFASASAALSSETMGYLRGIAKMLMDGYDEATVWLEGHTDSDASDQYNIDLSQRRVNAVKDCLVKNGAKPEMIKTGFKGETQPVADNKSEKGKANNRRVEIWLDSPDPKSPYCK